jgi:hypothetical protein
MDDREVLMARLPQVQYRGASTPQMEGPQVAVSESRQRIALINQAQEVAGQIAEADREYRFNKAKSGYADDLSAFRREAAKMQVVGRADIIAMGLEDVVDVDAKETFFKSEWYPHALEKAMDTAMDKYSEGIVSGIDRERFTSDIGLANNKILETEIEIAAKESMAEQKAQMLNDVQGFADSGLWESAVTAVESNPHLKPSEKEELKTEISQQRDANILRDELTALAQTSNPAAVEEYAAYLRTDEAQERYSLTPEEMDKMASGADRIAKAVEAENKAKRTEYEQRQRAVFWQGLMTQATTGELTASDMAGIIDNQFLTAADIKGAWNVFDSMQEDGTAFQKTDSDPDSWLEIRDAIDVGEVVKARELLAQKTSMLTETDWQAFHGELSDLSKSATYNNTIQTNTQIMNGGLQAIGIETTASADEEDKQASFVIKRAFSAEVANQQSILGRELTTPEKQEVMDGLTRRTITESGFSRWVSENLPFSIPGVGPEQELVYDRIREDAASEQEFQDIVRQITAALQANGEPVTASNISLSYDRYRKGR